jgi:hypothetical protein
MKFLSAVEGTARRRPTDIAGSQRSAIVNPVTLVRNTTGSGSFVSRVGARAQVAFGGPTQFEVTSTSTGPYTIDSKVMERWPSG